MKQSLKCKEVRLEDLPEDDPPPKKVHINYKKLVVPSRMRSSYWKYFGFPAGEDGKMITKDVIVCVLCKSQMVYNRNTSNLKMHLGSRHKNALLTVESEEELEGVGKAKTSKTYTIKGPDISNVEVIDCPRKTAADFKTEQMIVSEDIYDSEISDIAIIFPPNEEMPQYEQSKSGDEPVESTEINDAIINFLITDLVSPKIVEGKGFNSFVFALTHKTLTIPNERQITEDIFPNLYRTYKDHIYNTILSNSTQDISLSMEQWTGADNSSCLSLYVHYLSDDDLVLNSKLLTSVSFNGSETTEQWSSYLDSFFNEWNINIGSISAVLVAFHNDELKEALKAKNIVLVPCFSFLMQSICSEQCFRHPVVNEILEKCRSLIRYFQENKVDLAEDEDEFTDADGDENDFALSCDQPDTCWLTTYYMLRGMLRRKQAINNFLDIKPFENHLTPSDWKIVLHLLKCLEPLKTVVLTLFEEKTSLISLIKPLIEQVCSNKFTISHHDSALMKELKNDILTGLDKAYAGEDADDFMRLATKLDPRFKAYMQEDTTDIENKLVNLLSILVDEQGLCTRSNSTNKQGRLSSINVLFGNFKAEKEEQSNENAVKTEITTYQSESSALLEECPLEWWQNMKRKCPNLIKLVRRYHCVPAVTMLGSLFNLKDYVMFCSQRASLPVHIADSLLFLNINK